jgi:hypothetical protein
MSEHGIWLRLVAALGALALGGTAAVIVAVLAHRTPGPVGATNTPAPSTAKQSGETTKTAFPVPPQGAIVFSRQDGSDVLALAVVPGRRLLLQASVVGGQGEGVGGLNVSFRVGSDVSAAQACGAGCYRASTPTTEAPRLVIVKVTRPGRTTTWKVRMPEPWPPPDASALVARATRTYRRLRTFVIRDRLASGPEHTASTRWTIVAPDRLTYQVANGPGAVIIGARRWDRLPGGDWQESEQTPIHQPTPFWVSATDARVLENTKSVWRVSFFDPKTPGWFELLISKQSLRTLEMRMNTTAHFMHDVYGKFNAPLKITPP